MDAATIDTGAYVGYLRAKGPPNVVVLDDAAGNGIIEHAASGFWERVEAIAVRLRTDVTVADRFPTVSYFAGEPTPFAQVIAPFDIGATHTARFTWATGVFPGTSGAGSAFVAALPRLWLLPGYSLALSVIGGVAGDVIDQARLYLQQFEVVPVEGS